MGKFGFSFSAKRALGVTKLKSKIARATGIPTTKSGRQRKLGAMLDPTGTFGLLAAGSANRRYQTPVYEDTPAYQPVRREGGFFVAIRRLIGMGILAVGLLFGCVAAEAWPHTASESKGPAVVIICIAVLCTIVGLRFARRRKLATWRDDPATEKQKQYARSLGISFAPGITKGTLSDLITDVTGE